MSGIKIVTDSTADIPKRVREQHGIEIVPLKLLFGEESFLDGISMTNEQFYQRLIASASLPTTSQPSPMEFTETYRANSTEVSGRADYLDPALVGAQRDVSIGHPGLYAHGRARRHHRRGLPVRIVRTRHARREGGRNGGCRRIEGIDSGSGRGDPAGYENIFPRRHAGIFPEGRPDRQSGRALRLDSEHQADPDDRRGRGNVRGG